MAAAGAAAAAAVAATSCVSADASDAMVVVVVVWFAVRVVGTVDDDDDDDARSVSSCCNEENLVLVDVEDADKYRCARILLIETIADGDDDDKPCIHVEYTLHIAFEEGVVVDATSLVAVVVVVVAR